MSALAYAKRRGCAPAAVAAAIEKGRLSKSVRREGRFYSIDPVRADLEWAASTYSDRVPLTGPTAPAGNGEGISLAEARTRLETAKAQLAEIDLAERKGEMLEAAEVEAQMAGVFSSCKTKLLGVPSLVRQQDPSLTRDQVAIIETTIREALDGLADGAG